jgi:hypothetical protein
MLATVINTATHAKETAQGLTYLEGEILWNGEETGLVYEDLSGDRFVLDAEPPFPCYLQRKAFGSHELREAAIMGAIAHLERMKRRKAA